jgi:hypothetical protein
MVDRQTMINDLVSLIDDWDMEMLLDYAKETIRENFESLTDDELRKEYADFFLEEEDGTS